MKYIIFANYTSRISPNSSLIIPSRSKTIGEVINHDEKLTLFPSSATADATHDSVRARIRIAMRYFISFLLLVGQSGLEPDFSAATL